jgi:hypothetical protein
MPSPSNAKPAQTEHGSLLLQAEQPAHMNEVVEGRFFEERDSLAYEGKFLHLAPPEAHPQTAADRSLSFDRNKFNNCKEFDQSDLDKSTRAMRFMQSAVHIPSGERNETGKVINDGYSAYTTSLGINVVRPDKRIEYARMLYEGKLTGIDSYLLNVGSPETTTKVMGGKLPDVFNGFSYFNNTNVFVLPHFTPWEKVFNPDGSYVTQGSFTKDDGSTEDLHLLFKEGGGYLPNPEIVHRNLMMYPDYKKLFLYKAYKDTVFKWFYDSPSSKKEPHKYTYAYNKFYDMDMKNHFLPYNTIQYKCPNEPVNPSLPYNATTNPMKNCSTNPELLKYHVVNSSGDLLTQANALDCYTLDSSRTQLVKTSASNCNGKNSKFFHYIDLFMHVLVDQPLVKGRKENIAYNSQSPTNYQDVEGYAQDSSKKLVFNADQTAVELDPDVFLAGGGAEISQADHLKNFTNTLHKTLKTTRCIDCHGSGSVSIPQFAQVNDPAASLKALDMGGFINFANPSRSFRPNGMVHNCNPNSKDIRYSCSDTHEAQLRESLVSAITSWKVANQQTAAAMGIKSYRSLSRNERLPGRAKYKFVVTQAGLYNVWTKIKAVNGDNLINFRILNSNGTPISYTIGTDSAPMGSCYKWNIKTTQDFWEWSTPGRQDELAAIDQKGYLLLNDQKQPLPLANKRAYFYLSEGEYTLDVLGLTQGLRLDAVGVNRVENHSVDSRLEFQPDRRAIDEKNVSDYKRNILKFDLTEKLNLTEGKKAFFEVEVKKEFGGQNYVFRNPRFSTIPRTFNLRLKGIRVLINGKYNYPDATYNNFEAVVGDNQVLTYAPLVALTNGTNDLISFKFDELKVTTEALSTLYPKGTPPAPIEDRRCNDLDFFIKNIKPILFNAKVVLEEDFKDYMKEFPGTPRDGAREAQTYNCVSCHTANHPYFKMSTFSNNEQLCREALSRVDFQNFYQSLVIRGINGTGNHPKFVFAEKFVPGSDGNFKLHDEGQDYMEGRYKNPVGIASNLYPGPMMLWSKSDLGISKTRYSDLTATEKSKAAYIGQFRKVSIKMIDMDVVNYVWYKPEVHDQLLFDPEDPSRLTNVLSSLDVINPNPAIGKIDGNRNRGSRIYVIENYDSKGLPVSNGVSPRNGLTPLKAGLKQYTANAEPALDRNSIDYISSSPEVNSQTEMWQEYETLRDYYREKVIEWIRRENTARLEGK